MLITIQSNNGQVIFKKIVFFMMYKKSKGGRNTKNYSTYQADLTNEV